jgi:acyl CoA:acetate/3-ketoacid CoA transferase alpha subunit
VRVDGPASRNLDVFIVQAVDANGNVLSETSEDGASVDVAGAARLRINTGRRLVGASNTRPGGGK